MKYVYFSLAVYTFTVNKPCAITDQFRLLLAMGFDIFLKMFRFVLALAIETIGIFLIAVSFFT